MNDLMMFNENCNESNGMNCNKCSNTDVHKLNKEKKSMLNDYNQIFKQITITK